MTITVQCSRCGEPMQLEYEPNEFISLEFVHRTASCAVCKRANWYWAPEKLKDQDSRLPYVD